MTNIHSINLTFSIHRAAYEDIVKHLERLREERGDDRTAGLDQKPRDLSSQSGTYVLFGQFSV